MTEALMTSRRPILMGSSSTISSPVLADGLTLFNWQGGRTTDLSGPAPARANLSAKQAREAGILTSDTYGHPGPGSSNSADLQRSLASKLRRRLEGAGCPGFKLTWKQWDMKLRQPICALRASVPRTQGSASIGLPTPSGCSNGGRNNVVGRLDEWGGSSNPFRGTEVGKKRCASFEAWMMGYPTEWASPTVLGTLSFRRLLKRS